MKNLITVKRLEKFCEPVCALRASTLGKVFFCSATIAPATQFYAVELFDRSLMEKKINSAGSGSSAEAELCTLARNCLCLAELLLDEKKIGSETKRKGVIDVIRLCNAGVYPIYTLYDQCVSLINTHFSENYSVEVCEKLQKNALRFAKVALLNVQLVCRFSQKTIASCCVELAAIHETFTPAQVLPSIDGDCISTIVKESSCLEKIDWIRLHQHCLTKKWLFSNNNDSEARCENNNDDDASGESCVVLTSDYFAHATAYESESDLEKYLGFGAYGCVQKKPNSAQIAVKTLFSALSRTAVREMAILAYLRDARQRTLLQFYTVVFNQTHTCTTMHLEAEMIIGKDIEHVDRKTFNLSAACNQIFSAVAYLHAHGIAHRDIKPSNIMVRNSAETDIVLIDFSSACFTGIDNVSLGRRNAADCNLAIRKETENIDSSALCGTVWYTPPEALCSRSFILNQSKAHDVWSLGITILEIIIGTPLFFNLTDSSMYDMRDCLAQIVAFLGECPHQCSVWRKAVEMCREANEIADFDAEFSLKNTLKSAANTIGADGVHLLQRMLHWDPKLRPNLEHEMKNYPLFSANILQ